MADKKLSFKKHGNNLLVVDNGNTLVVLEDALNAQGEPQVGKGRIATAEMIYPHRDVNQYAFHCGGRWR